MPMFVRRILGMVVALAPVGVSIGTVEAAGLNFSLDVPAVFGGTWYSPSQTVRWTGSAFTSDPNSPAGLGPGVNLTGLTWSFQEAGLLFSLDASCTTPSGLKFNPGDVIEYKGGNYSMFLSASTIGLAPGAVIDSLGLDDRNHLIMSLAESAPIGGTLYHPSDLRVYRGGSSRSMPTT